ncbi:MAG TPA: DUF3352 domain-containing protein [Solirubrobacterales bacterium]|nr:DUF3352 domain-containing protein [Solirubrobacterales bacterium]
MLLAALVIAGCGGGDDGGDGTADPASVAPAQAPIFINFTLRPEGETKQNIDALAEKIAGIDNVGDLIIGELENSASEDGEEFDYEKEVEPWLGKEGGLFLREYEDDDFESYGVAIQTSDEDAARAFIDKQLESEDEAPEEGSYEGVDFKVEADDGTTIGVFDGLVAMAEDEEAFKSMVDASDGENLAGEEAYSDAVADVPANSAADIYVDIGGLIEESGGEIDPDAKMLLDNVGIEPKEATAVASVVPGRDYLEVDVVSDLAGQEAPSGDASQLLGSLDSEAVGAVAFAGFGDQLQEAIDELDKEGIPGEIPPNQLKNGLKEAGIDLDAITGSVEQAAIFLTGRNEGTLSGVLVLTTDGSDGPTEAIESVGKLLKSLGTAGVTIKGGGGAKGFEVRSPDLEGRELTVLTMGNRIAIGFGSDLVTSVPLALLPGEGARLADMAEFKEAEEALGQTPISGFVHGPRALKLAESFITPGDSEFEGIKPYLDNVSAVAIGSEPEGDRAKAKLIFLIE